MVQTVQKTVDIYFPDHRDFTVAVLLKGGRCPCCVGRAGSTVACRGGDSRVPLEYCFQYCWVKGPILPPPCTLGIAGYRVGSDPIPAFVVGSTDC